MGEALIVDAVRSPIGKRDGALAGIRGDELAAQVLNGLVARHDLDPAEIEDVELGCVTQIGEQGWNVGRMVPLVAGWPESVCGTTVDRQCGSSMQCNFNAAAAISSGQLDLVVSAGLEMMSRVPMGSNGGDLSDRLLARWEIVPQGISAELLAEEWNLSREELDAYSLESHRRAVRAIDEGRFEDEIVPVELPEPSEPVTPLAGSGAGPAADGTPGAAGAAAA
ncbi:MAG: thiolase family protein, partial [Actinomycetota bacterium]|nr:thiolase family protein [Actinomycetota bacterium]